MRIAAFMSGTGSNLRKILQEEAGSNYEIVMIFTDTADESRCNAKEIAAESGVPLYCSDIRAYYRERGHNDRKDMGVREEYDGETADILKQNRIDAVVLCGYMSVVTRAIYGNYMTINVHPADLRILDADGRRLYAGCMKEKCVEKVIEAEGREARSTVHLVTGEVDGGPILAVSKPVKTESADVSKIFEKVNEAGRSAYADALKRVSGGNYWMDEEERTAIDIPEEKKILRERMKEIRDRFSDQDTDIKSSAITKKLLQLREYREARTVMLYIGKGSEVRTEATVRSALSEPKKVVVPVTDRKSSMIRPARLESLEAVKSGEYGIPEPEKTEEVDKEEIKLVVVPGIAFDAEGGRIGYGRGFYDRFLKGMKAEKVGLAYEIQIVDRIRTEEKDVRMDKIITEERTIEVANNEQKKLAGNRP